MILKFSHKNNILKLLLKFRIYLFVFITALIWSELSEAQVTSSSDSLKMKSGTFDVNYDTSKVIPDSLLQIKPDSISVGDSIAADTTKVKKKKRDEEFKSKVVYSAKDSVSYSSDHSKFYLYGDVKVTYEDIELDAAYVEYDLPKNMVFASGLKDSTGQIAGKPVFKKGKESFKSETLYYDFKTKKGIIYNIVTEEEGGFLHAEKTKKQADGSIHIKNGKYTTCNLDHPHFYLALTKAVVIPDDKIVSGLAYLVVEDVPLPIVIPFGFFPNKRQATSGVLMPTFGQSNARGFSLENGGYYFALSQYFDVSVTGDIYSKGTWGVNLGSRYTVKYKFNGNLSARYYVNKLGVQGVDSGADIFRKQKDISITWSHAQDAKANPTSRFSASVNYSTTKFDQNQNYTNPQLMITSTKSSSISYNKSWTNFNLSVNLRHSQNSQTKIINMGLPSINFTANRIYPFKNKNSAGTKKWYENISINYTAQLDNNLSAKEDSFFKKRTLQTAQNGFRHSIPLSTNFKFLRYFNFTPSMNYTGMLYTTYLKRRMLDSLNSTTNKQVYYLNDTVIHSLSYAHGFAPTTSLSFNPSLYGMLTFGKNSTIRAIRHVMTPTVSFSFIPEIKNFFPDYNRPIKKNDTIIGEYSIYGNKENSYGPPPSCSRKSGSFSFGIGNNLEMKVKSEKDTVTGTKKIVLIQSFNISSGYNIYGEGNRQKL